jgi:hypothetical protein
VPFQRRYPFRSNVYKCICLFICQLNNYHTNNPTLPTSTVSKTLITPGCLKVRSFLAAFRARGRRDLLALMSNENMLQLEPSSCRLQSASVFRFAVLSLIILTRLVPFWSIQIPPSISWRSPKVYGKFGIPDDMAEATTLLNRFIFASGLRVKETTSRVQRYE